MHVNGLMINTKKNKIGCYIGDYTKIAIGTYINTGTVIDAGCNIVSKGNSLPKYINPFSWFVNEKKTKYKWEKFVQVLEISNNGKNLSAIKAEISMLKKKYDKIIY